jgi:hypothetical protein
VDDAALAELSERGVKVGYGALWLFLRRPDSR